MTLNQVAVGTQATISQFKQANNALMRQCLALGLKPGVQVQVLQRGRGNSPIQIRCRGTLYAIRPDEAAKILVTPALGL